MTMKTEMFQSRGAMILQEAGSMKWALSMTNMAFLSMVWKKKSCSEGNPVDSQVSYREGDFASVS